MCLGVPGKIVEPIRGSAECAVALVEFEGVRRTVAMACVPDAKLDDYVIVHAGVAIAKIEPREADEVWRYLRRLEENEGWSGASSHEIRR